MSQNGNEYIRRALTLARELTVLADEGETDGVDDGCAVMCGVIRDCAYKIRGRAEQERDVHRSKGVWKGNEPSMTDGLPQGKQSQSGG